MELFIELNVGNIISILIWVQFISCLLMLKLPSSHKNGNVNVYNLSMSTASHHYLCVKM